MGGGPRRKSTANVVLGVPKPKHRNGSEAIGTGIDSNGGQADTSSNPCKTFYLHKPRTVITKLISGTSVFGVVDGRTVEVKNQELGTIGVVPPGTAALIIKEGRDLHWSGEVIGIDKDRLSIKVMLCPT